MATFTRLQPAGIQNFRPENIRWYPEGTSAGFVTGDFVKESSGKIVIAAAAGTTLAASVLWGMALADASGAATTTNTVPVYVFDSETILRLPVVSGASSASADYSNNGTAYGIRHTATTDVCAADGWAVDKNEMSAVYGIQLDIPIGNGIGGAYPNGTQFGVIDFRINLNKVQGAGVEP